MIRLPHHLSGALGLGLTLAVLAIMMKVALPAGFMATQATATNSLPFALVICTGQGPMTVAPGEVLPDPVDDGAPTDKAGHDSPCAFAGHGLGAPLPDLVVDSEPVAFVAYRAPQGQSLLGLAPGRGLAAPPLPARGPPIPLT